MLLSHADDGTAETSWLWHDVDAESFWQQCCKVMLVPMLLLLSHAGDGAAEMTWP
jgi:hypothetical protein